MFDYIRDHLGYRIELQSLQLPAMLEAGKENLLHLSLINRGFATVFGEHPVCFVLIDDAGKVMALPSSVAPGTYKLGLWIPDASKRLIYNPRYAIRCANGDTDWWVSEDGQYGVNVLTTIEVK